MFSFLESLIIDRKYQTYDSVGIKPSALKTADKIMKQFNKASGNNLITHYVDEKFPHWFSCSKTNTVA